MKKIDMMIIGVQKAGTTSLKNYLSQHPHIESHIQTEFSYFTDPTEYSKGYDYAFRKYISNKDVKKDVKVIAKNAVIYTSERDLQLLQQHNPDVTIVLILRNPVDRAYSAYNMEKTFNIDWMQGRFENLVEIIDNKEYDSDLYRLFIKMGLYSEYLETIYKYFPKQQVKIFLFEDFKKDPLKVCRILFSSLGLSPDYTPDISIIHNKTAKTKSKTAGKLFDWLRDNNNYFKRLVKFILPHDTFVNLSYKLIELNKSKTKMISPLNSNVKSRLEDYFRPYNDKIELMTGMDLTSWNSDSDK